MKFLIMQSSPTSSLLGPNIHLSILFANAFKLRSSFSVSQLVSLHHANKHKSPQNTAQGGLGAHVAADSPSPTSAFCVYFSFKARYLVCSTDSVNEGPRSALLSSPINTML